MAFSHGSGSMPDLGGADGQAALSPGPLARRGTSDDVIMTSGRRP